MRIRRSRVSRAPAYPAMYPCHVSRTAATYRIPRIRVSRVSAYPAYPRIRVSRVSLPRIPYCRHVSRHVSHCAGVAKLRKTERRSLLLACAAALPAVAGSCAARRHRRERRREMGRVRKGGVVRVGNQFQGYFLFASISVFWYRNFTFHTQVRI